MSPCVQINLVPSSNRATHVGSLHGNRELWSGPAVAEPRVVAHAVPQWTLHATSYAIYRETYLLHPTLYLGT